MELTHEIEHREALTARLHHSDPEWLEAQNDKAEDWEQKWAREQGLLK